MTAQAFSGRRVLVTGHTGFKGAWLCAWLHKAGAHVTGFSHASETDPNLWDLLALDGIVSVIGDLNDRPALDRTISATKPEVVFHLAAQSLVRRSYRRPVETFATNVLGTVQLLDALRAAEDLRAVIIATSDKAYENVEQIWGYRESDPMGGHDPYSASKGATEIATAAMRRSYFSADAATRHPAQVASVRAGNVIGGGDWAEDRLIPDIVCGCLGPGGEVVLRQPNSIRPWQHVLEPLHGYMTLAARMLEQDGLDSGWNFGPDRNDERPVIEVAEALVTALGRGRIVVDPKAADLHEAKLLRLDVTRARSVLGWRPAMSFEQTVKFTADWYGGWANGRSPRAMCRQQIESYETFVELTK